MVSSICVLANEPQSRQLLINDRWHTSPILLQTTWARFSSFCRLSFPVSSSRYSCTVKKVFSLCYRKAAYTRTVSLYLDSAEMVELGHVELQYGVSLYCSLKNLEMFSFSTVSLYLDSAQMVQWAPKVYSAPKVYPFWLWNSLRSP